MATYKRIDGDYVITTINSEDRVLIETKVLTVDGNLDVIGNVTYINSTELSISDPFFLLAANNVGAIANIGMITQKTPTDFAALKYNAIANRWQISVGTTVTGDPLAPYENIAVLGNIPNAGGINTSVQFNRNGNFFGNANFTYDESTSTLSLQGVEILGNVGSTPTPVANSVAVYHKGVSGGGTGVFVRTSAVDDEVCSKTKAIVFSIIF